jgi:hypothetical protein
MQASAAGYGKPYSYRGPEQASYARNGGAPYAGIIAHGVTKRKLACVWPVWQIDPITLAGLYQHSTAQASCRSLGLLIPRRHWWTATWTSAGSRPTELETLVRNGGRALGPYGFVRRSSEPFLPVS